MITLVLAVLAAAAPPDAAPDPRWPLVRLADAREFGVLPEEARAYWSLSVRHQTHHEPWLLANYPFPAVMRWREAAGRCRTAWDCLDNVLYVTGLPRERKLAELDRLRLAIGDEAYHARRMPPPCPGWMFGD